MIEAELLVYNALKSKVKIQHETAVKPTGFPCVTYCLVSDSTEIQTDKHDIDRVSIQLTVWAINMVTARSTLAIVNDTMRSLDFVKASTVQLNTGDIGLFQIITTYSRLFESQY